MSGIRTTVLRLLLALGLAFSLWLYVSVRENPNETTSYQGVPVEIENLAAGLVRVDRNGLPSTALPTITIRAEGSQTAMESLRQTDIRAFADLTGLTAGELSVPVNVVTTRSGLARLTFTADPSLLAFRIEQEITRTVPLTVEVTGEVPFSFEQRAPQASVGGQPVTSATVRGPESRVSQVTAVRATADVNRLTGNYDSPRPLEPLDASGSLVAGVSVTPATVNLLVPIISSIGIKRVPIVPQTSGRPASGNLVTDIAVSPEFVTLTGSSGPLETVLRVTTAPVDISGASGTITRTADLIIPLGVALLDTQPNTVEVRITTRPINQPFTVSLPVEVVATNIPAGLLASVSPAIVQVELSGSAGQISTLTGATLQGTVDVSGLGPGSSAVTPTFNLPQGVTLTNQPQVTITLRAPATAQPTAAPTVAPVATPIATATNEAGTPTATVEPTIAPPIPTTTPAPPAAPTATPPPATAIP